MSTWATYGQESRLSSWRSRRGNSLDGGKGWRRDNRSRRGSFHGKPLIEFDKKIIRVHKHYVKHLRAGIKIMTLDGG
jgi:hypothetical protein